MLADEGPVARQHLRLAVTDPREDTALALIEPGEREPALALDQQLVGLHLGVEVEILDPVDDPARRVVVEESLLGWKEYEMEVVRDRNDNCIIICSIENLDPMGVHTGDSITVAPAQTLTDREYHVLRDAARRVLDAVGVATGGANVQFAVNPEDGRYAIIEMNPRVSRSSALASKATGFPIAYVSSLLAGGLTMDEIPYWRDGTLDQCMELRIASSAIFSAKICPTMMKKT